MGRLNFLFVAGLLLLNLLLIAAVGRVWFGGEEAPREARGRVALPQVQPLRAREPRERFQVVVAKDLFSPERHGEAAGPVKLAGTEDFQLLGTLIIGAERAALIAQGPKGRQKIQVVREGEQWQGVRLVEIGRDAVVLEGKDGRRTLSFPRK
ncbi:MAG: hypothetical protein K6T55_09325 [Syntrophobacterales bacterium]|nr:hypothetical protein [Syntrophobacterales bacterium]